MLEFAKIIDEQSKFNKTAWTWRDLLGTVGTEALLTGGTAAAGAAGLLAPSAGGGAAGAAAALGLGSNPVGWVIGGILIASGVAYAIYDGTRMTDDNIADLVERLEALDYEGTPAEAKVEGWIQQLNGMRQVMQLPQTTTDPEQMAKVNAEKASAMNQVKAYIDQMQREWPQVERHLEDWGFDAKQAEIALTTTAKTIASATTAIQQEVAKAKSEMLKDVGQASGVDITDLAKKIDALYEEITKIEGAPPVPETSTETRTYGLVQKILEKGEHLPREQVETYVPYLSKMHKDLESLLQRAKQKKASTNLMISKRAWRLSSDPRGGQSAGRQRRRQGNATALQKAINDLNVAYNTGATRINEDGIYGPRTSQALATLVSKVKGLDQAFRNQGVGPQLIGDPSLMRRNPDKLQAANAVLQSLVQRIRGGGQGPGATKEDEQEDIRKKDIYWLEGRRDLSENELLYYLDNKVVVNPLTGERDTIMGHIKANARKLLSKLPKEERGSFLSRFKMSVLDIIKRLYFGEGQTAPAEWDLGLLFDTLEGGAYGSLW